MPEIVIENTTLEQDELRGCARTVAEIEWLLLILVLLYQSFGGTSGEDKTAISMALFLYAAFIMSFHYVNLYKVESRWKLAIETWVMISFITWCLWFTGRLESPLVNTYLLVIITSSLTLGKVTTFAELCLIGACFLFLGNHSSVHDFLTLSYVGAVLVQLAPIILVAYITSMFSSDIRYGLHRAKLISEIDELTKAFNRRGFAIAADRLFGLAKRHERSISVLFIDSDNLKKINDTHGHKFGDALLLMIVKCIEDQLRDTDILARFGGDEFVALLPDASSSGAQLVAERVLQAVENTSISIDGKSINGTVSIGIATFPEDGMSIDAIVDKADQAMNQAKTAGRNRIVTFSSI